LQNIKRAAKHGRNKNTGKNKRQQKKKSMKPMDGMAEDGGRTAHL